MSRKGAGIRVSVRLTECEKGFVELCVYDLDITRKHYMKLCIITNFIAVTGRNDAGRVSYSFCGPESSLYVEYNK